MCGSILHSIDGVKSDFDSKDDPLSRGVFYFPQINPQKFSPHTLSILMTSPKKLRGLYSIDDAAGMLHIADFTMRRLIDARILPAPKRKLFPGAHWNYYNRQDVEGMVKTINAMQRENERPLHERDSRFVTVAELLRRMGCSWPTFSHHRNKGRIPHPAGKRGKTKHYTKQQATQIVKWWERLQKEKRGVK